MKYTTKDGQVFDEEDGGLYKLAEWLEKEHYEAMRDAFFESGAYSDYLTLFIESIALSLFDDPDICYEEAVGYGLIPEEEGEE